MASDLLNQPKTVFLSQDDNWFSLRTDIPRQLAGFVLISISGNPDAGQFFRLIIEGDEVEFTFATTPNLSGLQLSRQPTGSTLEEYRDVLINDFRANERISNDFEIIQSGTALAPEIRLVYKIVPGALIQVVSNAVGFDAVFFQAQYNEDYVNLFGKVHVYEEGATKPLVKLRAAYGSDRKAWFNLAGLFQQELGLPTEASLLGIAPPSINYEVHQPAGVTEYSLWHADSYGVPPTTERLTKEGSFYAVPGGSSGVSSGLWGTGVYQMCHAYLIDRSLLQFYKPITSSQPDWMYFLVKTHSDPTHTIIPRLLITYSDGTTDLLNVPSAVAFVPDDYTLYCFPSGPVQVAITDAPNWATKTAVRYEFQIYRSDDRVLSKIAYKLIPDCQDWRIYYLAYENGAGGIETVAMRGKGSRGYSVERSTFRRSKTVQQQLSRGEFTYFDIEGFQQYEIPSGWFPQVYVNHLRQLLVADRVWLLDNNSAKFLAANVVTNQADLTTADDDLDSLTIRIQLATPDINSHVL